MNSPNDRIFLHMFEEFTKANFHLWSTNRINHFRKWMKKIRHMIIQVDFINEMRKFLFKNRFIAIGVASDEDAQSLQALNKPWATNQQKSNSRSTVKSSREPKQRLKLKCEVCNKFFRSDYLKVSQSDISFKMYIHTNKINLVWYSII